MGWADVPAYAQTAVVTALIGWVVWLVRRGLRWVALALARPVAAGLVYDYLFQHPELEPLARREQAISKGMDYLRMAVPAKLDAGLLRAEVLGGLGVLLATDPAVTVGAVRSAPQQPLQLEQTIHVHTLDPPPPPAFAWWPWPRKAPAVSAPKLPPVISPAAAVAMGATARAED